jgi:hypothetical protein
MSYDLYDFLKDGCSESTGPLLRAGLSDPTISLLVSIIRDLVLCGLTEIEAFSTFLKLDIVDASTRGDVEFINKVIVPILQAEERVPLTISTCENGGSLKPIYMG